ncbi:MAG TPA: cytosine permease, partial [Candidatus Sulfotelmatobacter sp.]|nr:cytosine permease [Candidatus Sulfotelmatobacter sp.]
MHLGLDRHGIEPLAAGERTLSPRGLLAIWLAPGLGLVPFGVGLIAAAQMIGLGWWDGLAAIALGSVAAAGLVASVAAAGAPAGVPQMAVGRASFGRAIVLPALVDWAGLVTWSGIFTVFGAQALADLTGEGIDLGVWLVVMALGQAALAIVGLPLIRRFDAYAAVALAVAFAAITAVLAGHLDLSLGDGPNSDPATFVLMVAVAFGLNLGWAVTAADYARYVTPGTTRRAIFGVTFAGLAVPAIWLEGLGLAVARAAPAAADPVQAFQELVGGGPWGAVAMGAVVVATLAANGMLLYSASLSLLATGIRVSRPAIASLSSGMALAVA